MDTITNQELPVVPTLAPEFMKIEELIKKNKIPGYRDDNQDHQEIIHHWFDKNFPGHEQIFDSSTYGKLGLEELRETVKGWGTGINIIMTYLANDLGITLSDATKELLKNKFKDEFPTIAMGIMVEAEK